MRQSLLRQEPPPKRRVDTQRVLHVIGIVGIVALIALALVFGIVLVVNSNIIMQTLEMHVARKRDDITTTTYPLDYISTQVNDVSQKLDGINVIQAKDRVKCGKKIVGNKDDCFDVIVVGAGAAGSVIASKVSENGTYSVLLLEAGANQYNDIPIKSSSYALATTFYYFVPQYMWPGETVIQYQNPRQVGYRYTNGRLTGGGTAVNTQMYVRPTGNFWNRFDAAAGGYGVWNAYSMNGVLKSQENFTAHGAFVPGASHGTSGPVTTHTRPVNSSADGIYMTNLLTTAYSGVVPLIKDINDGVSVNGIFEKVQLAQRHDLPGFPRMTSFEVFLNSSVLDRSTYLGLGGRKLTVKLQSSVIGLIFDDYDKTRCVGVTYLDMSVSPPILHTAYASEAVVLSTGIHDAQTLQVSGIGPVSTLTNAGVPVRVANENVGRHWKNHMGALFAFLVPGLTGVSPDDPFTGDNLGIGGMYARDPSPMGSFTERGLQFIHLPGGPNVLLVVLFLMRPLSEGTIDIQSPDIFKMPLVDPRGLTDPRDLLTLRMGIQEFASRVQTVNPNIFCLSGIDLTNSTQVDQYIMSNPLAAHHWASSVRMGTNATTGVVDWRARVFGTNGLRVCSTAIFPDVADGNTATPTMAVGEMCSRLLLEDIRAGIN